ncbi:DEAD/DEAH box helicase [Archangium sp.]|uniref:DEAD/DEAH box helicase n=1 Tax=Archangium sp. TaxID=1872627 RepID=UPI002D337055|nr:DEAD/DEAH box helicase [Archangium sp.]HYO52113.1 DEAD/DEAH box helicase [Archangium sp.]
MSKEPPAKSISPPHPLLRQWLTPSRLIEIVGEEVYAKGKALLEKDRVVQWKADARGLDAEGQVRGRGGVHHEVWMAVDERGLEAGCACNRYFQDGFCEHLVALGLAWLKSVAPEELALPPPATASDRPRTPESVQQWLEANHVTHLRRVPLVELGSFLPPGSMASRVLYPINHHPLTMLLDGTLKLTTFQDTGVLTTLEQAAWARAEAEVGLVRQGLEHERLHPEPPPPTDARLVPLTQALQQVRARVREHAVPRLLPPGEFHLGFADEPPVIHLHEAAYQYGSRQVPGGAVHQQCAQVDLLRVLMGEDALSCSTCSPRGPARCVHALSALDVLLEVLGDSRRAEENARLADSLLVKPGRKLLEALDRASLLVRARREPTGTGFQVSFRLEGVAEGAPKLRPYLHKPLKRGGVSKGTQVSSREVDEARATLTSPEEVEAFELCLLAERQYGSEERHRLLVQALKLLAHSPRLVLDTRRDAPLRVRSLPLGFAIEETEEAGGGLWVQPVVGETRVRTLPSKTPQPWLFAEPEEPRLTLVSASPAALAVLGAVMESGGRLPAAWRTELVDRLGGVEAAFPLALPPSLEGREVPAEPGLLLRLRPTGAESLEGALLVRPLPEAPPLVPGEGAEVVRGLRGSERVRARRNLESERVEAAALVERLGLPVEEHGHFALEGPEAALGFLERLEPLASPSLRVEWEERPWSVVRSPDARGLKVAVRRERDWFGVAGGVQLEGERVELAVLLDALRRGHRYVPLAPGRWMRLTEALREQLTPLADLAHASRGKWEVSAAAAPVLDGLAEAGAQVEAPPDWRHLAGRIREAQRMEVPVPASLKAELRDYQREGFVWMARLTAWGGGGCLADDMGLGKTLQALALLLHRAEAGPALVVAPTSVCFNWVREAARFAPSLKVHGYREAERESLLSSLGAGDVVVVSYTLLMREAERFSAVSFATLVLDEAQAVKNPDTARAKAVRALKAEARMALSGTPVENRLSELWSLFRLVFPGLLGSRESFRERFAGPIERTKDPNARAALARVVRPFLLRRTKGEVARELPPRVETVVPITLSEGERRLYEDTRLAALARLEEAEGPKKRFEVLAALTRLRLAACHPRLVDADSPLPSSKLERLLEVVEAVRAGGGRALVFSQFVRHLALVREALEARGVPLQYLDGQTPAAERETRVAAFQRGEGDVFLISLKAGGTGLNLTAADHVLHLDPWWNPAAEDQATDRAHRIGQTKPVTVTRLISEGTIEEAILALHEEKRDLANSLLSEADGAAALSTEQLLGLLRHGSQVEDSTGDMPVREPGERGRTALSPPPA